MQTDASQGADFDRREATFLYSLGLLAGCGAVGSARRLGRRGRRFESSHPDLFRAAQILPPTLIELPDERHMTEVRRGSFETLVSRSDTHAVLDLEGDGRVLLVLFGGIAGGVSMPVFEFFRLTSAMPGKKAFLRDPLRSWYQRGVPGIGESVADVRAFLTDVIDRADVDRVVMAGASAGGYAALLFGAWCRADEVIAFSPQTFIDPLNRRITNDSRWAEQIDALNRAPFTGPRCLDLLEAMRARVGDTRFQVHVSDDDNLDMIHAKRIAEVPGVEIFEHEAGGHRLVKSLRDRGLLQPMLENALSIDAKSKCR